MGFQVQRLSRILRLFGVMGGPGRCYQRDRADDATKTISNNIVHFVEHDGARDDDAATPDDTFDGSSKFKYKRGAARAGPSSDSFQADAEVDSASSGADELKMLRRSISDPVRTSPRDTTPDARTGPHIAQLASASSTTAGAAPRNNTSASPSPLMSSSRSAAPAEDEPKGDAGTGIAGPVDHSATLDIMLAEDAGSHSESGIRGFAPESRLSQPVRTTSPEDVIAQTHDQRKGPGETGMLGKYATHTDTTTTSFSFSSATIGFAPAPRLALDSQMLRRGGGTKHSKRSTSQASEVPPSSRPEVETRGYVRRDHHDLPASGAAELAGANMNDCLGWGCDSDGCANPDCNDACPPGFCNPAPPPPPVPATTSPPETCAGVVCSASAGRIDASNRDWTNCASPCTEGDCCTQLPECSASDCGGASWKWVAGSGNQYCNAGDGTNCQQDCCQLLTV